MKLQDTLPEGVTVDGKFYRLDFDFRNVLRMIDILDDDDLMPEARAYNALKCLCKHPKNIYKVLDAVEALLFERSPKRENAQKVTDFVQDAGMIRAAFRQAYGIDLYTEKLHWIEFSELLNAIPEGNRYSEVVGIRARPLPAPTKWNQEERNWLMKAKADLAIHLSDKEQAKRYQEDVGKIFTGLMGILQKGSENNV
jgi:hypothetical protein